MSLDNIAVIFRCLSLEINRAILDTLYQKKAVRIIDIAESINSKQNIIVHNIRILKKHGLIEKIQSRYDLKIQEGYKLTDKGYHIQKALIKFTKGESKIGLSC